MIHVIDNFLPDPDKVRRDALISHYIDWQGFDGEVYRRVSLKEIPDLKERIEQVMGPVKMLGMGYRLNYTGELPNQAIHSDLGWGTHALVLYLCHGREGEEFSGGTGFWRHEETGTTRIDPGDVELFEKIGDDWNRESPWGIWHFVGLKFNRALIYESALFHSRYPFEAFGTSPETGRLIAVAFFTPENLP